MDIFAAAAMAQATEKPVERVPGVPNQWRPKTVKAATTKGICSCRGACGHHGSACSMKAAKGQTTCQACMTDAMKAGGPGSGRHTHVYWHEESGKKGEYQDSFTSRTAANDYISNQEPGGHYSIKEFSHKPPDTVEGWTKKKEVKSAGLKIAKMKIPKMPKVKENQFSDSKHTTIKAPSQKGIIREVS